MGPLKWSRDKRNSVKYQVWDTKLARAPKPYYAVQLCCYSEMLADLGNKDRVAGVFFHVSSKGSFNVTRQREDDFCFEALSEPPVTFPDSGFGWDPQSLLQFVT
jgi:hypothetical protein